VARARSLSEFQTSFPDERSCAAFLFERRWPQGFVCPACGGGRAGLLKGRAHTHECLGCGRQTSITAGTAMHRSKLPLTVWFWAAHLMATHSNGMSAVQLEAQLRRQPRRRKTATGMQADRSTPPEKSSSAPFRLRPVSARY